MYDELTAAAQHALQSKFGATDVDVLWQRPAEVQHGDVATACALQLSKRLGQSPGVLAGVLVEELSKNKQVEKAEVAGPGYVNLWLKPAALLEGLSETRKAAVAKVKKGKQQPIVIDYSAPNIAKPLGIHHILSTVIGQSLANIYRHQGYEVIGINHLGDWGTQFGKLAVALQKWGKKDIEECTLDDLLELYVKFHNEAETNAELEDEARAAFKKIEEGDPELRAFWEQVVKTTMKELNVLYERLHVSFDYVHGESFYEGKMQPIIDEGKKKGVFVEGNDGALIVEFPEETGLSPAVVVKGDDATIYMTRDLATARYRIDTFNPQEILYVVDIAQEYYFRQLFNTLNQLEWKLPHMEHVMFGRMSFRDQKMSTRKGNILKLQEVLDEAVNRAEEVIKSHGDKIQTEDEEALAEMMGVGAVVYGVLSQNRKMNMVFDWDKFLSFDGNSAPYLQYTHARACSVLRKAGVEGEVPFPKDASGFSDKERMLVGSLMQFELKLEEARESHMPHVLANYLYSLCQDFNAFYNDESILQSEEPVRTLRLALTSLTASVIKAGAHLLTIRVPDRM